MVKTYFTALIILLLLCTDSLATNYYVSNSGVDSNNGTSAGSPFNSLYKVNQVLSNGDIVYLNRGDIWYVTNNKYDGEGIGDGLYIRVDNVTIDAYGSGAKPIIDASSRTDRDDQGKGTQYYSPIQVGVRYGATPTGVTIKNLILKGPALGNAIAAVNAGSGLTIQGCTISGAGYEAEALIRTSGSNHLIDNCTFDQITGNPNGYSKSIEIAGGNGHIVSDCTFYGYASGGALRFSNDGTGGTIERNFFYHPDTRDDSAWALVVRSCSGGTYIIKNNIIDMTNHGGLTSTTELRGMAFWYDHSSTTRLIYNNTFVSNNYSGCAVNGMGGSSSIVNFYNNIVVGVDVAYNNDSPNLHMRNNIFYQVDHVTENGTQGTDINTKILNPNLFDVSMSNDDPDGAMLTNLSIEAIDSGFEGDANLPTTDFNGNERSNIDIGAFEKFLQPPKNFKIVN